MCASSSTFLACTALRTDERVMKDLDLLECMKLVNYIRGEVRKGNKSPNVSSKSAFESDQFLQPVLKDDAVLYSLEDAIGDTEISKEPLTNGDKMNNHCCRAAERVSVLETELALTEQLFANYKALASRALENPFKSDADSIDSSTVGSSAVRDDDSHYFNSYSYNGESTQGLQISILIGQRHP